VNEESHDFTRADNAIKKYDGNSDVVCLQFDSRYY